MTKKLNLGSIVSRTTTK